MTDLRAKITKVVFFVEYPDGSTKESSFEPTEKLNAILLSETFMTEEMKSLFTKSNTDWKKNPAMIIVDGQLLKPNCEYPDCQNA
jgi:hypothetical protein